MITYEYLSKSYRFGVAKGNNIFLAFHGEPNKNDDYYTITEISEDEYKYILEKYQAIIVDKCADKAISDRFRNAYILNKSMLYEGWALPRKQSELIGI